jgi:hypothetical protein
MGWRRHRAVTCDIVTPTERERRDDEVETRRKRYFAIMIPCLLLVAFGFFVPPRYQFVWWPSRSPRFCHRSPRSLATPDNGDHHPASRCLGRGRRCMFVCRDRTHATMPLRRHPSPMAPTIWRRKEAL